MEILIFAVACLVPIGVVLGLVGIVWLTRRLNSAAKDPEQLSSSANPDLAIAFAGAAFGTVAGSVFAAILAGIAGLTYDMLWGLDASSAFLVGLLVCLFGALAGFTAGVGIVLLGTRTRSGLEWAVIVGTGIVVSTVPLLRALTSPVQLVDLILWAVAPVCISMITAWLVSRVMIRQLGQRLPRGPMKPAVLLGYLVAVAFVAAVGHAFVAGVLDMAYHM